jgi:hypothetical protein
MLMGEGTSSPPPLLLEQDTLTPSRKRACLEENYSTEEEYLSAEICEPCAMFVM